MIVFSKYDYAISSITTVDVIEMYRPTLCIQFIEEYIQQIQTIIIVYSRQTKYQQKCSLVYDVLWLTFSD